MIVLWLVACADPAADPGTTDPAPLPPVPAPSSPPPEPDPVPPPVLFPTVLIDEILPSNDSVSSDEAGDFDDWVELHVPGDADVDLGGWGLADDAGRPDWTFPAGVVIPAGGRLVVWLDDEPAEGALHATVGVDADADELVLFSPDGAVADAWTITGVGADVVLGRFPSGSPARAASIVATPGNPNPTDPGVSLDPSDALFPDDRVVRIELFLDPDVEADLVPGGGEVPAAIGFEGAFLDVTLALKGQLGSSRSLSQKAAFRVDVDGIVPGQRLRGLEDLTLNNMVQDRSCVHERLAYRLFREAGVPAPRTAYAEVWLNGEYRGLYLNVEPPADPFLERWFADPEGNLYEGEYGQDFHDVGALELDQQGDAEPTDRSELDPLVALLASPPDEARAADLEALVDLDRTLAMLAGEAVLAHWDGYFYAANNWRVYHEPATGKVTLLPWGLDQTFGGAGDVHSPAGDLAAWCLGVPSCRARYDLALWDLADRLAGLGCAEEIDAVVPLILPFYETDPYREGSPEELVAQAAATAGFCATFPPVVLGELP